MHKTFAAIFLLLVCGCRTPVKPMDMPPAAVSGLVGDAMDVMLDAYPPAKTRLQLRREASDAFGTALVEALRANGYAVAEPAKADKSGKGEQPPAGLGFDHTLALSKIDGEARLVLRVGAESLSRLYAIQETDDRLALVPQSAWSRKR